MVGPADRHWVGTAGSDAGPRPGDRPVPGAALPAVAARGRRDGHRCGLSRPVRGRPPQVRGVVRPGHAGPEHRGSADGEPRAAVPGGGAGPVGMPGGRGRKLPQLGRPRVPARPCHRPCAASDAGAGRARGGSSDADPSGRSRARGADRAEGRRRPGRTDPLRPCPGRRDRAADASAGPVAPAGGVTAGSAVPRGADCRAAAGAAGPAEVPQSPARHLPDRRGR